MDTTIVNVALPTIGRQFHVHPTPSTPWRSATWSAWRVFIPASGWLGDRFGATAGTARRIVIFTVASALCGLAGSLGELVVFRVLQGVGGGLMARWAWPCCSGPSRRPNGSGFEHPDHSDRVAPALGPVLGGLFVTDLSWRWVFYVNVPIGIAAVFGLLFLAARTEPGPFDLAGFSGCPASGCSCTGSRRGRSTVGPR